MLRTTLMFLGLLSSLVLASGAFAQSQAPATPAAPAAPAAPTTPAASAQTWRERLADPDLDRREAAFEACVRAALYDPALRGRLERWSTATADEHAWTARLVLRAVEQHRAPGLALLLQRGVLQPSSEALGGEPLLLALQQLDAVNANADHDPWTALRGTLKRVEGVGATVELDAKAARTLQRTLGRLVLPGVPQAVPGADGETRSVRIESDGETVRVSIRREIGGEVEEEIFEAPSMDQLLREHRQLNLLLPSEEATGRVLQQVRTDVLGVKVAAATDDDRQRLGVPAGLGVVNEETVPGTIADVLHVSAGSLLVELNGRALRTPEDITRALSARGPDRSVTLTWYDPTGERLRRDWTPRRPLEPALPGEPSLPGEPAEPPSPAAPPVPQQD